MGASGGENGKGGVGFWEERCGERSLLVRKLVGLKDLNIILECSLVTCNVMKICEYTNLFRQV